MSYLKINNVAIRGVAACVPQRVERNIDYNGITVEEYQKYLQSTGIECRHCAIHDGTICTSDLCFKSAEKLLEELNWDRNEIGLLVFISHTADYKLPATACILQDRLGLPKDCMAFDSPLGCSGYVYGLSIAGSLLSHGYIKKALLLVGNTQSIYASPTDKSTALLFGDAGSATALEYDASLKETMDFQLFTDGSGKDALIVPDGGCRNPFNEKSLIYEVFEGGNSRNRTHEALDGVSVFSFAISQVPRSFKLLAEHVDITPEHIDYLLLHQANKFICDKIRKKLKYPEEKVPSNIHEYGNTSATSIPLMMVTEMQKTLQSRKLKMLMTGFGVGLSIGTACITTEKIICPPLLIL